MSLERVVDTPVELERASFRAVLSNRNFLYLWLGQVFSQLADKVILVYLIVLLVAAGFNNNSDVSHLTLVFTIPAVLFGSLAGVFVDRWNKKNLMITSNLLRGLFVLALPIALWFQVPSALWIYALTFLISTVTQFFAPAEISMIPALIEKKNLLTANSLFTTTMMASMVVGLGLGEALLRLVGDLRGHYIIGLMYFISALFLFFIHPLHESKQGHKDGATVFRELKEGFVYVGTHTRIIFMMIRMILVFSAFAALTILVIGFIRDILFLDKRFFGYFLAVAGLGMGVTAILIGRIESKWGKERLIAGGFWGMGLILLTLANLKFISQFFHLSSGHGQISASEVIFAFVLSFLLGMFAGAIAVPIQTFLQEEIPEHLRGKVFGVQNMLVNTAMTLPMALAGISADFLEQRIPGYGVILVMNFVAVTLFIGVFIHGNSKVQSL